MADDDVDEVADLNPAVLAEVRQIARSAGFGALFTLAHDHAVPLGPLVCVAGELLDQARDEGAKRGLEQGIEAAFEEPAEA